MLKEAQQYEQAIANKFSKLDIFLQVMIVIFFCQLLFLWAMCHYTNKKIRQADIDAKSVMTPDFNRFLNVFINYHSCDKLNQENKAQLREEEWKMYKMHNEEKLKNEKKGFMALFSSNVGGALQLKLKFEMEQKV